MSDLLSPATGPVALPAKVASPSILAPGVPTLAAFIDLMIGKLALPAAKAASGNGARQADADTGKGLPDDGKKALIDPALAWLFTAPAIPAPQPITVKLPQTADALAKSIGFEFSALLPARGGLGVGADPGLDPGQAPTLTASAAADTGASAPTPTPSPAARGTSDLASSAVAPKPAVPQPVPLGATPPPAAATLPALFALAMTPDREPRDADAAPASMPAVAALQSATAAPVAPTGDAQRQTLDLGARDWPQKMIDHIETLRDNANANDTSIRLKPEALGRVDISLKTDTDGAIAVRFTAEQPATRALLVDAAPQLTAAADARGIRLSGTSVDLSGQGDHRPRPHVDRPQDIGNHLAAPRGDDSHAVDDGRIA